MIDNLPAPSCLNFSSLCIVSSKTTLGKNIMRGGVTNNLLAFSLVSFQNSF